MKTARAYWVAAPGRGELRAEPCAVPEAGQVSLRALYSGVSPGTERLVGMGLVPEACGAAMACAHMVGSFALPVKYGYCLVGEVEGGTNRGRRAFAMHPHQEVAVLPQQDVVLLPEGIPATRATLLPSLETSLNAVWDAGPLAGHRALVVGGGLLGLLVVWVLRRLQGGPVVLCERHPTRRAAAAALPWVQRAVAPEAVEPGTFAVAFHATGEGEGLQLALDSLAFEGTAVDLSWYGTRPVSLQLGGGFHFRRNRIVASQVGAVAPSMRAQSTPRQRLEAAMRLLGEAFELDALLSEPVPFGAMPEFMHFLYHGAGGAWAPCIDYSRGG